MGLRRAAARKLAAFAVGGILAMFFLALFLSLVVAGSAYGFPEAIRRGYQSCGACHVSPTGGGALNGYGRSTSSEFLSTWAREGEEGVGPGGLAELPSWLAIGGDSRYINVNRYAETGTVHSKFWMQNDFELALSPSKNITFGGTVGLYGPDQRREFRRNYLKLAFGDHVTLRAGRFTPAYGVNLPDHTLPTRRGLGLGQGLETYNIEGGVVSKWGEVFLTGVYGQDNQANLSGGQGYSIYTEAQTGFVGRAAVYLPWNLQVGGSYLGLSSYEEWRQAYGGFVMWGPLDWLYVLAEMDRSFENAMTKDVAFAKLGWEAYRGVHLVYQYTLEDGPISHGAQLVWFPRPHWEFSAEYRRSLREGDYLDSGILMFHHYL